MPRFAVGKSRDYFCVVGSPISHSRSPAIHRLFGEQFAISLDYDKVEVERGGLASAVSEFRSAGGVGMNVTIPLKEEAFALGTIRRPRASQAGAANTLWFGVDGAVIVDNTDGIGLVRDLTANYGYELADRRVLLLGAGGAARGVVPALLAEKPALICIANRTVEKAEALIEQYRTLGHLIAVPLDRSFNLAFDLVINATALSLQRQAPNLNDGVVHPGTWCYDMTYSTTDTSFLAWARERGVVKRMDGIGMLVEQAAESFELWHGRKPRTAPVIATLRTS